ncbi:hypothetical protein [Streptomyces sp. NPDC002855]|uniref:hypothetical protein n=1 Tax=Streptomyces sp. NPDC002855 TaxID=3154437 RepID=UPI003323098E
MKLTITILTVVSGVLPTLGVWLLWIRINDRREHLRAKLRKHKEIMEDLSLSAEERSLRLKQEVPTESNWGDVLHIRERIELMGLEQAPDITAPAVLASIGLVSATAAGVLSTWFG